MSDSLLVDHKKAVFRRRLLVALQYTVAILVTLIILFPIFWMLISSVKSSEELLAPVPTFWPKEWHFENYLNVLKKAPFGLYYFNTIVSTAGIMALQLGIGIFAAYGFAKGDFKGKNVLFLVVLGALMIPIQVTFVPIYVMCARMQWINTFWALIIPNAVSAYFIFMLRQTFMSVDNSYLEAAKVDGMGRIGIIFRILCPMCKPTLLTVTIITFIDGWNSYFWPKMVTTNESRRTIAIGVAMLRNTFAGMQTMNNHEIMAGAVIGVLPIIVVFVVLQKYLLTGFSKAAMK
ncbi:carbohydrate ABC transporter permease [Angelakisella massiliensis]|uniref:carbohydrate ABC transporter permease n=1 Tax=Angelakisella massiliensis TaxID=1871018 RepID=UPI0008F93690|nr:carbohydrate ABC transporter permease [Angelakisella massiliensis]